MQISRKTLTKETESLTDSLDEETSVLIELGLTPSQAKVFLALVHLGPTQIGTISKATKIHREHIYKIMHSLEDEGLIEKELGSITEYNAVPFDHALSMMVKRKQIQIIDLKTRAQTIIDVFKTKREKNLQQAVLKKLEEKSQFAIIPGSEAIVYKLKEAFQRAQLSTNIVTSKQRFSWAIIEFAESYKKALERNVRIRIASEKHLPSKKALEIVETLKENPNFEVRYFSGPPSAIITIFDNKDATVTKAAIPAQGENSALWSNNNHLIILAKEYFESKWAKSEATIGDSTETEDT